MIYLTDKHFIGEGLVQKCYEHPEDSGLCIKIIFNFGGFAVKKVNNEIDYYKLLAKRNVSYEIIPKYYGTVETNMGTGNVFELVKDYDGNISRNMQDCLQDGEFMASSFADVVEGFKVLKKKLLAEKLAVLALYPQNILYRKDSADTGHLVIIDNIGSKVLIPLEYYFDFAACFNIEKRWRTLINNIKRVYKGPKIPDLVELLEQNQKSS